MKYFIKKNNAMKFHEMMIACFLKVSSNDFLESYRRKFFGIPWKPENYLAMTYLMN